MSAASFDVSCKLSTSGISRATMRSGLQNWHSWARADAANRMMNVVTLIPPAVPEEPPPMNMKHGRGERADVWKRVRLDHADIGLRSGSFDTWRDLDPMMRCRGAIVVERPVGSPSLRSLREADAAAVLAAFQSSPDLGHTRAVTSLATAQAYVAHLCHPEGPHRAFAIVNGHLLVGLVAITINARSRTGWFWYWMNRESRGRGWTSRAASQIANWALISGVVDRLELEHRIDNPESASIATAAGFIHEGTQRQKLLAEGARIDVLTYGRLISDQLPSAASPTAF